MIRRSGRVLCAALALSLCAIPGAIFAQAQSWSPQRNVEFVSPTPPGGTLDATIRMIQHVVSEQKLIPVSSSVMNRPGGQHAVAYNAIKQRPGDPHVLGLATSLLLLNHIAGSSPISHTDLTPIALVTTEYFAFVVPASSPFQTGRDVIEALKKNPDALTIGTGSITHHVIVGALMQAANVDMKRVKIVVLEGGKQSLAAAGGHVDVAVSALGGAVMPLVTSGKVRVIAIGAPQRMAAPLASVPTWSELGYRNANYEGWRAIVAAKGLTSQQIAYWEGVMRRTIDSRMFREIAEKNQWEPAFKGSEETAKFMDSEYGRTRGVMSYLGLIKS